MRRGGTGVMFGASVRSTAVPIATISRALTVGRRSRMAVRGFAEKEMGFSARLLVEWVARRNLHGGEGGSRSAIDMSESEAITVG